MVKLFFILVGIVGTFFLINAYIPQAWSAGFNLPIGHGIHVPWALCIIGGVITVGIVKLKAK